MNDSLLTHRERVRLALEHQATDRIPISMICSGINKPAYDALQKYLRETRNLSVERYLQPLLDVKEIQPKYVGPKLAEGEDIWGVRREPVSYGQAAYDEIKHYPLGEAGDINELANHRWPTTEWFDYTAIPEQVRQANSQEEYCLMVFGGNIFETAWYMRGFEQALMDMALSPDLLAYIMEGVTKFYIEHSRRMLEAADGEINLVFTADDIGGQAGLLMSLDMWAKNIKPYHEKLNSLIHGFGAKVIYHSDGSVMAAVDGLIDMGIDILQALQFDAKDMDPAVLKETYGERLCFEGGISVQKTLPFGTTDEVRQETLDRIAVLGEDGGYILGPSHVIQAGTPPENVVAMFDTAYSA